MKPFLAEARRKQKQEAARNFYLDVIQKNTAHTIQDTPRINTLKRDGFTLPPCPGNCLRLFSFQMVLSNQRIPTTICLLKTINMRPRAKNTIAGVFVFIQLFFL
jgi:hypothetical protein